MIQTFEDKLNLLILEKLCSGFGVEVNIYQLAKQLKVHRNTIKKRVDDLILENHIIDQPLYPLIGILDALPLWVIELARFPRNKAINTFIESNAHVWAAYFKKMEHYNTLLLELHEDLYTYQQWDEKRSLIIGKQPLEALFFSTKSILKYQPSAGVQLLEKHFQEKRSKVLDKLRIDSLSLTVIKLLANGEGIRTNENLLAHEIGVNRKTVKRRITKMLQGKVIYGPFCRFPRIWAPPEYVFTIILLEVLNQKNSIIDKFLQDPHIAIAANVNIRRFNLLLFGCFYDMEEFMHWEEITDTMFPECIGEIQNYTLSPKMTFAINQVSISKQFIGKKLENFEN
jgi:predicted regulator of amino acid metabolism with ACT domain